ncbi:MAG TPA: hypothetical protein VFI09_01865 [Solirubrobacterales bacterium]|nr:hypothetical protein [Solirubrobacterales bacterium]
MSLALLAVVASLGLLTASASASITHEPEPFSPLTGSGSGLTLEEASGIAIDEATGNVFVTDGGPGHERVAILGAEGSAPAGLAPPYEIAGFSFGENTTNGLAYDNSPTSTAHGTLYVTDRSTATVRKYTLNATSEKYEPAGEIAVPNGTSSAALSVDRNGNLYVGAGSPSFGAPSTIYKFSPSGALLAAYDLSFTPGQVAVDSAGDLFVVAIQQAIYKFPADGSGEIDPSVHTILNGSGGRGVAIDPSNDHVFAALGHDVSEYDTAGNKIDEFGAEQIGFANQVAVNSATERIYVADAGSAVLGHHNVNAFGPTVIVPTTGIGAASNVTGTEATLNGSINPEGIEVSECFFEWGEDQNGKPNYEHEVECEALPPTDSAPHLVSADISGLAPNGKAYHFRLVAKNENGSERSADKTFVTADTVATQAATEIGSTTATINGALRPEGNAYSSCDFEYGLTRSAGFEEEVECNPPAGEIEPDFSLHPVSLALSGLQPNATYKFRLTATNSEGTLSGKVLTFTTLGPPQISEVRASFAGQSSVTLEAKIDPRGFGTSYRFEWGPTSSYGNSVPAEFEPFIGSGEEPVSVKASLSGLSAGAAYHYRVVATNSVGTSESPDQTLETLNSCGLPDGRCFELVSPRDAGPVAAPGETVASAELVKFQAAPTGPGALAYIVETGFPDATKGAEVLYEGHRTSSGWESSQLNPPILVRSEISGDQSASAITRGLSEDLSCAVVQSNQPLTDDASMRLVVEAGGSNLYRRNPDGSYSAITRLAPLNPDAAGFLFAGAYSLAGMSHDCGKAVFTSKYRYPGIPVEGTPLYEWDEGTLRNAAVVPGPSGEVVVSASASGQNVVSEDGSRVFFSAARETSPNSSEIGKSAVFVREDGATTRDLSLSETSTPDTGATFKYATADGSRVFFTANAGLTSESSSGGTDLYEYDLESDKLTDLSVSHEAGGAQVGGFIGASRDGAHVYFTARAQLVPGQGPTMAQNLAADTYSIYGEEDGVLGFTGTARGGAGGVKAAEAARVSPDGRYLLFESTTNVTAYDSHGEAEAYLYDAEASSEATVCVSCRQDGKAPFHNEANSGRPLAISNGASARPAQSLTVSGGQPRVFFKSVDSLAPGAPEGEFSLYEWSHGQVFRVLSEPPGLRANAKEAPFVKFAGASADGSDLYLVTTESLSWEDGDGRSSVYDVRIGGGFPEPPPPAPACDPSAEGSCPGGAVPAAPGALAAGSATFNGPGNAKSKARHKKTRHKRHHRKKRHASKRGHASKKHKGKKHAKRKHKARRHANGNRRAGK